MIQKHEVCECYLMQSYRTAISHFLLHISLSIYNKCLMCCDSKQNSNDDTHG